METREPDSNGEMVRRRTVLKGLAAVGAGSVAFRRALSAQAAQAGAVTPEMVAQAEWIAGLKLTDAEREEVAKSVRSSLDRFEALRKCEVGYDVAPALQFNPAPGLKPAEGVTRGRAVAIARPSPIRPADDEALAFLPVSQLAALLRSRQVTSVELTRLYLEPAQAIRPDPEMRGHADGGARPRAGGPGRLPRSPQVSIGGRCTASPGARRT